MATVLITGCNRGIGLQLCMQYSERGDDVIAVVRSSNPELDALPVRVITGIDVGDGASMSVLKDAIGEQSIDILLNNAGILRGDSLESLDYDGMEEQFRINTLGPLRVTEALLPNLGSGSKLAIVSSRVGSIEDNTSGGYYGYRMSKAAVNMAGMSLSKDLQTRGIAVALMHPGMVATEMTGRQGIAPAQAAAGLIARMDELEQASSGTFWHAEGERLPW
jgi:NAD(P)-dependent dehydrogenase (short-subunit alcohol dehydrogenase family)